MGTLKIRGIGPIAIMSRIIYNIRDMKGGGIVDNGYTKRIRERVLSLEDGTVFVTSDFADIADTSTIRQSLSRLVQSGTLRRILKGVYEKPKYSKLLDEYRHRFRVCRHIFIQKFAIFWFFINSFQNTAQCS